MYVKAFYFPLFIFMAEYRVHFQPHINLYFLEQEYLQKRFISHFFIFMAEYRFQPNAKLGLIIFCFKCKKHTYMYSMQYKLGFKGKLRADRVLSLTC